MINFCIIGLVIVPILWGLLQYILKKFDFKVMNLLFQFVLLSVTIYVVINGEFKQGLVISLLNVPTPVGMVFRLDSLSMTMILLNNIIFFLMTYASHQSTYYNKLFIFLTLALQGLINGIFLSTDLFNLYILIELSTIIVTVLIMYKKDGRSLYDGMVYLIVNMVGMAFFLMGIGYIYKVFGVLDFNSLSQSITLVPKSSLILPFAFLMTGVSIKAAFLPLFSWSPKAQATASAPTVVSSILSGIFVKVGIYLFVRVTMLFSPVIDLSDVFLGVGIFTAVTAAILAMAQSDIKLIISYSTISQVGIIMLGLNNDAISGFTGGVFYMLNHGIFKVLMFFCVGLMIKIYKTRNIEDMNSLWRTSKILSLGYIIGILSLTGFPLLGSGVGKYMIGEYFKSDMTKMLFMLLSITTSLYCIPLFKVLLPKTKNINYKMVKVERNTILILSSMLIFLGLGYTPILKNLLSYNLHINSWDMASKIIEYIFLMATASVIYLIFQKFTKVKAWIKSFDLSFNTVNFAVVSYFFIVVLIAQL